MVIRRGGLQVFPRLVAANYNRPFERDRAWRLVVELARRQVLFCRPAMDADLQPLTAAMRRKRPVPIDTD